MSALTQSGLTPKREKLVDVVVNRGPESITEAGRLAGMSRIAASIALRDDAVSEVIAKRREGLSDKARGAEAQLERLRRNVASLLGRIKVDSITDPMDAVNLMGQTLKAQELLLTVKERFNLQDPQEAMNRLAVHNARLVRIGRYLQVRADRVSG